MILQNPMTCFDPLYRIEDQLSETYREHTELTRKEIYEKSMEVLSAMQIKNPQEAVKKYLIS